MPVPLEDDFCDIVRKASRGRGVNAKTLASQSGIVLTRLDELIKGSAEASEDEAREVARHLGLDPGKLADSALRRWGPHESKWDHVRHHPHDPHPSNGYLFFLQDNRTAALIDPAGYPKTILDAIAAGPYTLRYILVTHKHADHCDATADIYAAFPDAQIVMHRADVAAIGSLAPRALQLDDNEEVPFGDGAGIRMLHTPGHTDGSVCFLFKSTLFSGDTLFAGSIGGAFGEKTGYLDILHNIEHKLFKLDDATVVMPGHGPPTTIGEERAHNPFF